MELKPLGHGSDNPWDELSYDLEIEKAVRKIKEENAKIVGIQLPDGLKPMAKDIVRKIEGETGATCLIWAGTNFGACDLATDVEKFGADLLIAWGHSEWKY